MISDLYLRLYDACHDLPGFSRCAHFVALRGKAYDSGDIRLMLIGRAPNGWGSLDSSTGYAFARAAEAQSRDTGRFDEWVDYRDGVMYSGRDSDYCIEKKPFWTYAQEAWRTLGGAQGQATDIQIQAKRIQSMKQKLNELLAANTGKPLEQIAADTERDNFMTAQEALAYGIIDKVIDHR